MRFALVGNQNSGKTTLFNQLTGSNQHVGNFPGVTIDAKEGKIRKYEDTVVDLPGIYSLSPYTSEEIVTRDFIIKQKPDALIDIVDATNLERNLYLSLQLMDLHIPMVIALNMMDELRESKTYIDVKELSKQLGIVVIPISAVKDEGVDDLIQAVIKAASEKQFPWRVDYADHHHHHHNFDAADKGPSDHPDDDDSVIDFCVGPVHRCIHGIAHQVEDHAQRIHVSPRFAATKLVEGDQPMRDALGLSKNELELIEHSVKEMENELHTDREAAMADMRYSFIEKVCALAVHSHGESPAYLRSEKIDNVVMNKYLAIPLFLGIMLLIFWLTFSVFGSFLSDLLAAGIDSLSNIVDAGLTSFGINPVIQSLIIHGVFAGVGSVLSFLPIIVVLFIFLSILEDSGYMARVAFVMDKLLRKIGLSGKSFVPMLIGFGCTVPAVLSTRTLSSDRDRKMTIFLTPFMSCSAKLPIYAMLTYVFFPKHQGLVMMGLYVTGILLAIVFSLIFKNTLFKGNPIPFVMELPNYRFPSLKTVSILVWEKAKDFITRAFTVIFLCTLIIWFLQSFDFKLFSVSSDQSMLAYIGRFISPIFAPLGFNDWRLATALICGFSAKEAVLSSLSVLLQVSSSAVATSLATMMTPASALSFLTFVLLYTPCVAAIATIKKELNSGWQTLLLVIGQCALAWLVSFIVYSLARLFI